MTVGTGVVKLTVSKLKEVLAFSGVPLVTFGVNAFISVSTDFVFMFVFALSSKLTKANLVESTDLHLFAPG